MTKTRAFQVRLSKDQHIQLQQLAGQRGFSSLATYLRYCGLHHDFLLLDKVTEMQRNVGSLEEKVRAIHTELVTRHTEHPPSRSPPRKKLQK